MAINEEKFRAFFSDEEKVKELRGDEEFMRKVSEGLATPEVYVEAFKKLGLELSTEEAKVVQETVTKITESPTQELDDSSLSDIAGGGTGAKVAAGIGIGVGSVVAGSLLTGCGFEVAALIYNSKAIRALKHGNMSDYRKYDEKCDRCSEIGLDFATLGGTAALRHYENS